MKAELPEKGPRASSAMSETLRLIQKMGSGAGDLLARLKRSKTPRDMAAELEGTLATNRERREAVSARLESLYTGIQAKKEEYAKAPKARQRILEAELRSMLADYKAQERTLNILLSNERNVSTVLSRMEEVAAYGMAGLTEDIVDDVTDAIDEAATEADAVSGAIRDLEKAGRSRASTQSEDNLWDELADFDSDSESNDIEPARNADETDPLAEFERKAAGKSPAEPAAKEPKKPNPIEEG